MKKLLIALSLLFPCLLFAQRLNVRAVDKFNSKPTSGYETRKQHFLNFTLKNGEKEGRMAVFFQMIRVANNLSVEEKYIQEVIDNIYKNRDCNDFEMNGLVRLLYMDNEKHVLSTSMREKAEQTLLDFKYFWDDARRDTTYKCYHTENHQALYHTAELLAGQLLKAQIFKSGMTGEKHMAHAEKLLLRWLDFRFRFGFSEWLSTSYYDVEVMLLANLCDFAENKTIKKKAEMVLDLLLFDLALNNYRGTIGATTGRIYASKLLNRLEVVSSVTKICFGTGIFYADNFMGATSIALSNYRCPKVIQEIAVDNKTTIRNLQQSSINVEDAPKYGLSYDNELDVHLFWGMQEFIHPQVIGMSKQISEKNDVWPYRNYNQYIEKYNEQATRYGKVVTPHLDRFALSEANIETYRTKDYMLSCANDYRQGASGYQQHIWQATLSRRGTVFTNHPGSTGIGTSPNYWAGNSIMPRAAQHKNVMIAIYNITESDSRGYTHAYFPRDAFDEVIEKGSWVFGRKGNGYIALFSHQKTDWKTDDKNKTYDLMANGRQNVWICEMGSKKEWGKFSKFIDVLSSAAVSFKELNVQYNSPSLGKIEFGWQQNFGINEVEVNLRNGYRYDNPYCKTIFDSSAILIKKENNTLRLDWAKVQRESK